MSLTSRSPRRPYPSISSSQSSNDSVFTSTSPSAPSSQLDDFHHKFRTMELNRKAINEENQNTIRMQRQQIDKLRKDNDRLKEDLALETRQARQANQMGASAQIAKLQDQGEFYSRKIDVEKRRIEELDKQIKRMQQGILVHQKEMASTGGAAGQGNAAATLGATGTAALPGQKDTSGQSTAKQIRILENRLDKALVKFNEALAHNKQLRETIDNLRRERVVFDGIYRKLERELMDKKAKMAEIIEFTDAAYESRDLAQNEMIALKDQADREQSNFELEWSQLGQMIEKDRKLKDYQKNKERERNLLLGGRKYGDPALEEEQKLRKKVTKGAWSIAKDKANIHLSMEKVQSYEEAFAKIQKATRITDIDELVQAFVNAEDQNFSLFNYVNDLSNEIEKVEEQIGDVHKEIEKYHGSGAAGAVRDMEKTGAMGKSGTVSLAVAAGDEPEKEDEAAAAASDAERKRLLSELEEKLRVDSLTAAAYEDKYHLANRTIHSLKSGIQTIFERLGCNLNEYSAVLGNAGVTESNMMTYLGIIEAKTNGLLELFGLHRKMEEEERNAALGVNANGSDRNLDENGNEIGSANSPRSGNAAGQTSERAYRGGSLDEEDEDEDGDGDGDEPSKNRHHSNEPQITIQAPSAGSISDDENGEEDDEEPEIVSPEQYRAM